MKRRTASCPSCGGPVIFPIGTMVAVCGFCQSAIGRGDKDVEDYGKVSDLIETSSRLRIGLTGTFKRKEFTIRGRVQYRHPAGGVWDEWYLAFPAGRWGWLTEAQGKTYLMSEVKLKQGAAVPEFDKIDLGQEIELAGSKFGVKERGIAKTESAEGDIPWAFHPGAEHRFVDLEDARGWFATLEYDDPPRLFVGQSISLDDLSLVGQGWQLDEEKIATSAMNLNCPNCGGTITLRAPDQSLRVTCANCNSMLDAENGKLSFFKTLKSKERFKVAVPLGTEGTLFGVKYTVIGFMRRYATWEGQTFPWNEYLLYEPKAGYRWLVQNEGHWSFVEPPVKPISSKSGTSDSFNFDGDNFRIYDRGVAHVRYVIGEFYWKVEVGEKARTADFIAPPRMISFEWSGTGQSKEVNISVGTYLTVDEVEKAFGVKIGWRPFSVGTIQPYRGPGLGPLFLPWAVFAIVLVITLVAFQKPGYRQGADGWLCWYGFLAISAVPAAVMFYRHSFEVSRWQDSDYSPYSTE